MHTIILLHYATMSSRSIHKSARRHTLNLQTRQCGGGGVVTTSRSFVLNSQQHPTSKIRMRHQCGLKSHFMKLPYGEPGSLGPIQQTLIAHRTRALWSLPPCYLDPSLGQDQNIDLASSTINAITMPDSPKAMYASIRMVSHRAFGVPRRRDPSLSMYYLHTVPRPQTPTSAIGLTSHVQLSHVTPKGENATRSND
jgi:hypothetical protein